MKYIITIMLLILFHGITITASVSEKGDPDSIFDGVLDHYVSKDGLVNYKGLKEDKEFMRYILPLFYQ